uniref:Uncharacterized protein n=1 Tax=Strigamia maritima TaxID=126957 RepID=T1IVG9_STRMM
MQRRRDADPNPLPSEIFFLAAIINAIGGRHLNISLRPLLTQKKLLHPRSELVVTPVFDSFGHLNRNNLNSTVYDNDTLLIYAHAPLFLIDVKIFYCSLYKRK